MDEPNLIMNDKKMNDATVALVKQRSPAPSSELLKLAESAGAAIAKCLVVAALEALNAPGLKGESSFPAMESQDPEGKQERRRPKVGEVWTPRDRHRANKAILIVRESEDAYWYRGLTTGIQRMISKSNLARKDYSFTFLADSFEAWKRGCVVEPTNDQRRMRGISTAEAMEFLRIPARTDGEYQGRENA
jgi:hypothetical protein